VHLVWLDTERHFTFFKAHFVDLLWRDFVPEAESIVFVDYDVVLLCPWHFVAFWLRQGVALVEDVGKVGMSSNHPLRCAWRGFLADQGIPTLREVSQYYNAGFVGIHREYFPFLEHWRTCVDAVYNAGPIGGGDTALHTRQTDAPVETSLRLLSVMAIEHLLDQDGLNMAVMASSEPISDVGPEGMAFLPGSHLMTHAVGAVKPWQKRPLLNLAATGRAPSSADRAYWDYAGGPIVHHDSKRINRMKRAVRLAQGATRFVGRG
jgi:hypothetical protein